MPTRHKARDILTKEFLAKELETKSRAQIARELGCYKGIVEQVALEFGFVALRNLSYEERFFAKLQKCENGCIEFIGGKIRNGYGQYYIDNNAPILAHRYAWILQFGNIPDGMCVCHKCDNPACCNVNHLFLGTHKENMQDAAQKGKTRGHQKHRRHRVIAEDIPVIEELYYHKGLSFNAIAKIYKVHHKTISKIIRGITWSQIPRKYNYEELANVCNY